MNREARAADLLARIEIVGLQTGVNEFDLYSKDVREVFRNMSAQLAGAVQAALTPLQLCDAAQLAAAVRAVQAATATQRDAQMNRLDNALAALLRVVDASTAAKERVEVLEQLVATLQAARLADMHAKAAPAAQQQQQQQQAGAAAAAASPPPPAPAPAPAQAAPKALAPTATAAAAPAQQDGSDVGKQLAARAAELSRALRQAAEAMQVSVPAAAASGAAGGSAGPRALPLLAALLPVVQSGLSRLGPSFWAPLCARSDLSDAQAATLADIDAALREEYGLRRAVLVERAKVTLQAFEWSPRLAEKGTAQEAAGVAAAARRAMAMQPQVTLDDAWALRPCDVVPLTDAPTSTPSATLEGEAWAPGAPGASGGAGAASAGAAAAAAGRKRSAPMGAGIKSIIIGKVPDRGGRPDGRAREASMPEFRPRSSGGGGGGGG